jgi:hypothetical protein
MSPVFRKKYCALTTVLRRYVIHLSSGTAGFVGAWFIGPRIEEDLDDATPNNILLMLVGAGILWVRYHWCTILRGMR